MGIRLGVFFGGRSVEHEVSIISAMQAIRAFDKAKYDVTPIYIAKNGDMHAGDGLDDIGSYRDIPALLARARRVVLIRDSGRFLLQNYPPKRFRPGRGVELDFAFPVVHGTTVEDGDLQGWFKTIGIPFAGCDVTASALGMDKCHMKTVFRAAGIPVLDALRIRSRAFFEDPAATLRAVEAFSPCPVIVKPVNLGSSVGIGKASSGGEIRDALEHAFLFAGAALVERAIADLREINCAVLGDEDEAVPSECEEPINTDAILSYADKYGSGRKAGAGAKGMSGAKRKLPADIPPETRQRIQELAVRSFRALGANGVARIDFLMDRASGEIWVNEINTTPGSLAFYLFEKAGIPYPSLLDRMVSLGLKRQREADSVTREFETNILADFASGSKGAKR